MFAKRLSAAVILLIGAPSLFAQAFVTVSIGHAERVNEIVMHPELPVAFSAGDDGRVLRWDLPLGGLVQQTQLADVPIELLAHHPNRNQITVFARERLGGGRLIGWDWDAETILFNQAIDGTPRLIRYSPAGTFLVVATNDFDSLRFYSSQTGNQRDLLAEGFGSVSFVQIARSERNILTYIPSRGEFIYWELQTGRELQVVQTERRVDGLTLIDTENQRLLAGFTDEAIVVLDNLTGVVEARFPLSPVLDLTYSPETDTLYALTERFGDRTVRGFRYANGRLRQTSYRGERVGTESEIISAVENHPTHALLSGAEDGSVEIYTETTGRPTVLGTADYLRVEDLAFVGNALNVAAGDRVISFASDLFTGIEGGDRASIQMNFLNDTTTVVPDVSRARAAVDGQTLVVWESGSQTVWRLDEELVPELTFDAADSAAVSRVRPTKDGLLVLFRDGLITLLDEQFETQFEYRSSGVQDAVWDPDIGLVIAQTQGSLFGSSIIVVDPNTGETVPLQTGAFLTRSLAIDSARDVVYALALVGDQNSATAQIVRYSGRGLRQNSVLFRGEGGRTAGEIVWDESTQTLFTTLSTGRVTGVDGGLEGVVAETSRQPVRAAPGERILATGNADGTVSLFWKESGRHLADIIVFPDGWIITAGRGYLTSSRGLERYLTVVPLNESARPATLDELELNLPLLIRPDF